MAQFRYRLQTLLEQKIAAKEDAQNALSAAQRDLGKQRDELEECRREEEAAAEKLRNARASAMSPDAITTRGEWIRFKRVHIQVLQDLGERAVAETKAQAVNVTEAEERLSAARENLALRSRDVEVLEKHRERCERRFREETDHNEMLDQEEIANIIFLRGRAAR
jgi:flagellar biosynthesis chaperone FliJ